MKNRKNKHSARNVLLFLALLAVICIISIIIVICNDNPKEEITSQQALEIVLDDLGLTSEQVSDPHIHEGTYDNQDCYNVYIKVNGKSLTYVVSTTGEILHKGEGSHSH